MPKITQRYKYLGHYKWGDVIEELPDGHLWDNKDKRLKDVISPNAAGRFVFVPNETKIRKLNMPKNIFIEEKQIEVLKRHFNINKSKLENYINADNKRKEIWDKEFYVVMTELDLDGMVDEKAEPVVEAKR